MGVLQQSAKHLLEQLDSLIDQCQAEDFSRPLPELSGATFGQHIRHILEFFICLYDARNERKVNYDHRKHDPEIEIDKNLASSIIHSIHVFLDQNKEDFEITFEANYALAGGVNQIMKSSFYRELTYNIEHAIHHFALLKIAVCQSLTYIELPEHFGVASSTIRFRSG